MAPSHNASWFSYNITRPYPFRWFTPVVVIGGIVLTILLTLLNYVTTGYTLVNDEVSNPNATVSSGAWLPQWPSFLIHKVKPQCEALNLPLGSQFITNQIALTYTLTDVWQPSTGSGFGQGISSTLTYYNNVIENCTVNSVELDYSAMDRSSTQFAYSEYGAVVRTYTTCEIMGVNGSTRFNLTQEYDYVPEDMSFSFMWEFLGTNFLSRNATSKSSLYWGESLMSMYWASSSKMLENIRKQQTSNNQAGIRKGIIYFYRNTDAAVSNITDSNFFEVDFRFVADEGKGNYTLIAPNTYGQYEDYTRLPTLISGSVYPNIWESADYLAKSAYSTVLTDLGQVSATPNILTDPEYLSFFTLNFTEAKRNISNAYPGPTDTPYGTSGTGTLGTTPSVISTKYLCQVPKRKPAGDIFVSVVVADLVFLQALWFLSKKAVALFLLRRRPGVNQCAGCAAQATSSTAIYPEIAPTPTRSQSPVGQVEMGGLLAGRRRGHQRSASQQRLVEPGSMDIGER
jgi:hypothetical protein